MDQAGGLGKGISHEKSPDGTVWKATYVKALDGYLLQFNIQSLDREMTENLEHCVEQIKFFDPTKARVVAGDDSRPYNPRSSGHH